MKDVLTFVRNFARLQGRATPREFNVFLIVFIGLSGFGMITAVFFGVDRHDAVLLPPCLLVGFLGLSHATVRRLRATGRDWPLFASYVRLWSIIAVGFAIVWLGFDIADRRWPLELTSTIGVLLGWAAFPTFVASMRAHLLTNGISRYRKWNWSDD